MDEERIERIAKAVQSRDELPPEIARLWPKFDKAIEKIQNGITEYQGVMSKLARYDEYPDAVEIGERGVKTSRIREDSWRGIADDFHVLQSRMIKRFEDTGTFEG
jgi:hypothetical protein